MTVFPTRLGSVPLSKLSLKNQNRSVYRYDIFSTDKCFKGFKRIDGKTVIVTGAANGIGAALARHFAENGANVMCADIDEKALKKDGIIISETIKSYKFNHELNEFINFSRTYGKSSITFFKFV